MHLTVSRRLLDKLAAARDALSHSHPGATDVEILELGLDLVVERHRKRRGIGAKPRQAGRDGGAAKAPAETATEARTSTEARTPTEARTLTDTSPARSLRPPPPATPPPPERSRHVPASVWRAVWERDHGRCIWPLEGGGVCGSTRDLQLDHVDGWARGGETTADRCRILCRWHNDLHARALYGDAVMDGYTRPERGDRCSEAVAAYGLGRKSSASRRNTPAYRPCARATTRFSRSVRAAPRTGELTMTSPSVETSTVASAPRSSLPRNPRRAPSGARPEVEPRRGEQLAVEDGGHAATRPGELLPQRTDRMAEPHVRRRRRRHRATATPSR